MGKEERTLREGRRKEESAADMCVQRPKRQLGTELAHFAEEHPASQGLGTRSVVGRQELAS